MARVSLICMLVLGCIAVSVQGLNITSVLEAYPNYGLFNQWLSMTGVASEVNARKGLTVLATTNSALQSYLSGVPNAPMGPGLGEVADTLRYQILLTYYGIPELQKIVLNNYTEVTTLLQTTGRTNDSAGFVDIYHVNATGGSKFVVGNYIPDGYGNRTIVGNVTASPYTYSVLEISSVLRAPATTLPAPIPAPTIAPAVPAAVPARSRTPKRNAASMTSVRAPLTLIALFIACMAIML